MDTKKPNDSAYVSGDLWGLNNSGANGGIFDADIDAPEAWDITVGSDDVIVVVLDSGINVTHQDLESNYGLMKMKCRITAEMTMVMAM